MSLATTYLRDVIGWRTPTGTNDRNEPTWSTGTVLAFVEGYDGQVRNAKGEVRNGAWKVWVDEEVLVGDELQIQGEWWHVLKVEEWTSLSSESVHRVAYL